MWSNLKWWVISRLGSIFPALTVLRSIGFVTVSTRRVVIVMFCDHSRSRWRSALTPCTHADIRNRAARRHDVLAQHEGRRHAHRLNGRIDAPSASYLHDGLCAARPIGPAPTMAMAAAGLNLSVEHATFEASGQGIAEHHQGLFIGPVGNWIETGVGVGNPHVFSLYAVNPVAEDPPASHAV
jgi:hypothetical protein